MYGIFTYIYHKNQPNVGKYTIHGSYGIFKLEKNQGLQLFISGSQMAEVFDKGFWIQVFITIILAENLWWNFFSQPLTFLQIDTLR